MAYVTINPRYLTYTKDEVQQILDDHIEATAESNPVSLIEN